MLLLAHTMMATFLLFTIYFRMVKGAEAMG